MVKSYLLPTQVIYVFIIKLNNFTMSYILIISPKGRKAERCKNVDS